MTNQDLLRAQQEVADSLTAVTKILRFLNQKLSLGLPPFERADFIAEKAHAEGTLIHLSLLKANLSAAAVVVQLNPAKVARLDELSAVLDQAIRDDFILNATLELAIETLDAANEVSGIINSSV